MNIEPIDDRIIFKKIDLEVKTKSGIILGQIADDRENGYGKVLAVGPGKWVDEKGRKPMTVKEGQIIIYNERVPMECTYKGERLHVIRESDVYFIAHDDDVQEKELQTEGSEYKRETYTTI